MRQADMPAKWRTGVPTSVTTGAVKRTGPTDRSRCPHPVTVVMTRVMTLTLTWTVTWVIRPPAMSYRCLLEVRSVDLTGFGWHRRGTTDAREPLHTARRQLWVRPWVRLSASCPGCLRRRKLSPVPLEDLAGLPTDATTWPRVGTSLTEPQPALAYGVSRVLETDRQLASQGVPNGARRSRPLEWCSSSRVAVRVRATMP